jgi:hypothetical protein
MDAVSAKAQLPYLRFYVGDDEYRLFEVLPMCMHQPGDVLPLCATFGKLRCHAELGYA